MKIGSSIALIVLGAILAFAISDVIDGIDLTMAGYILMGGGAIGLVLSLIFANKSNTSTSRVAEAGPQGTTERVTESKSDGPGVGPVA